VEDSGKPIEYGDVDYPDRPRVEGREGRHPTEEEVHRL
jgi:hypothetical protein